VLTHRDSLFFGRRNVIVLRTSPGYRSLNSPSPVPNATLQFAVNCKRQREVGGEDAKLIELLEASTAASTRRAYDSDLRHFAASGGSLPAAPLDVARYLCAHADCLSVATLARRLVAIGQAHLLRGFLNPTTTDLVRLTMRGIRRTYGKPQRRAAALRTDDILLIVSLLGDSLADLRDRALLLVGFVGAFRRSELVAVDYSHIRRGVHGCVITVPRSKADQEGLGREVIVPYGRTACPIKALDAWLSAAGITEGPVFRSMHKGGRVGANRLSPEAVAKIVKHRVKEIGLDSDCYSGHSLRTGFVTSAAAGGMPTWRIKAQTGHASDAMVGRYIRQAAMLKRECYPTVL
jgi:integrase